MDPIRTLTEEHRLIEKVLDALEGYVRGLGVSSRPGDLQGFVNFLRDFTDGCHHGKEEDILFEELIVRGASREAGPVAVMLHEHDEGRRLIETLSDFAERASWSESEIERLGATATAYIGLLRSHIQKEDKILYPLAEKQIGPPARERMAEKFERYEQEETGRGEHERLHHLAETLIERYGEESGEARP